MRLALITAGATFALDQVSKLLVVQGLRLIDRGVIEVFPPFLVFRMAWNQGVNFGLFANGHEVVRWALILVALAISAWVYLWVKRENPSKFSQISAGLLIGGALGNVIDRLIYGAVADFLNMSCCGFDNPYAFNVADVAIFAGALGLVVFTGRGRTPAARPTGKPKSGPKAKRTKTP
jgi:signal peptidase II